MNKRLDNVEERLGSLDEKLGSVTSLLKGLVEELRASSKLDDVKKVDEIGVLETVAGLDINLELKEPIDIQNNFHDTEVNQANLWKDIHENVKKMKDYGSPLLGKGAFALHDNSSSGKVHLGDSSNRINDNSWTFNRSRVLTSMDAAKIYQRIPVLKSIDFFQVQKFLKNIDGMNINIMAQVSDEVLDTIAVSFETFPEYLTDEMVVRYLASLQLGNSEYPPTIDEIVSMTTFHYPAQVDELDGQIKLCLNQIVIKMRRHSLQMNKMMMKRIVQLIPEKFQLEDQSVLRIFLNFIYSNNQLSDMDDLHRNLKIKLTDLYITKKALLYESVNIGKKPLESISKKAGLYEIKDNEKEKGRKDWSINRIPYNNFQDRKPTDLLEPTRDDWKTANVNHWRNERSNYGNNKDKDVNKNLNFSTKNYSNENRYHRYNDEKYLRKDLEVKFIERVNEREGVDEDLEPVDSTDQDENLMQSLGEGNVEGYDQEEQGNEGRQC